MLFACETGLELYVCDKPGQCTGGSLNGSVAGDSGCADGATGPLCDLCFAGYYTRSNGECAKCENDVALESERMIRLLAFAAAMFGMLVFIVLYTTGNLGAVLCCLCRPCVSQRKVAPGHANYVGAQICGCTFTLRHVKLKLAIAFAQVCAA